MTELIDPRDYEVLRHGPHAARTRAELHALSFLAPHSLRHTFVTMALDAGVAERDIAISTGHADTRLVTYYDRGRDSIHRNATHNVAAYVQGAL